MGSMASTVSHVSKYKHNKNPVKTMKQDRKRLAARACRFFFLFSAHYVN